MYSILRKYHSARNERFTNRVKVILQKKSGCAHWTCAKYSPILKWKEDLCSVIFAEIACIMGEIINVADYYEPFNYLQPFEDRYKCQTTDDT